MTSLGESGSYEETGKTDEEALQQEGDSGSHARGGNGASSSGEHGGSRSLIYKIRLSAYRAPDGEGAVKSKTLLGLREKLARVGDYEGMVVPVKKIRRNLWEIVVEDVLKGVFGAAVSIPLMIIDAVLDVKPKYNFEVPNVVGSGFVKSGKRLMTPEELVEERCLMACAQGFHYMDKQPQLAFKVALEVTAKQLGQAIGSDAKSLVGVSEAASCMGNMIQSFVRSYGISNDGVFKGRFTFREKMEDGSMREFEIDDFDLKNPNHINALARSLFAEAINLPNLPMASSNRRERRAGWEDGMGFAPALGGIMGRSNPELGYDPDSGDMGDGTLETAAGTSPQLTYDAAGAAALGLAESASGSGNPYPGLSTKPPSMEATKSDMIANMLVEANLTAAELALILGLSDNQAVSTSSGRIITDNNSGESGTLKDYLSGVDDRTLTDIVSRFDLIQKAKDFETQILNSNLTDEQTAWLLNLPAGAHVQDNKESVIYNGGDVPIREYLLDALMQGFDLNTAQAELRELSSRTFNPEKVAVLLQEINEANIPDKKLIEAIGLNAEGVQSLERVDGELVAVYAPQASGRSFKEPLGRILSALDDTRVQEMLRTMRTEKTKAAAEDIGRSIGEAGRETSPAAAEKPGTDGQDAGNKPGKSDKPDRKR